MKKIIIIGVIILFISSVIYYNYYKRNLDYIPEISVVAGCVEARVESRIIDKDETADEEIFKNIMDEKESIPYIWLGDIVQIDFGDITPDSYELIDDILSEDGKLKWGQRFSEPVDLIYDDHIYYYTLEFNMASGLNSNLLDWKGKTFRGFRLICNYKNKKYEYGFVIRTDAFYR